MKHFKLIFRNQSIDTKITYHLVRETKTLVFLEQDCIKPFCVLRVNKKTLNVKGITKNYKFDVPQAVLLKEL